MPDKNLTIRMDAESFERLEAESRRTGVSCSEMAETLVEEGLRMQRHPGIVFRPGPAGRRPALAGGPDVWEVMRVCLAAGEPMEHPAAFLGLDVEQVRTAVAYYSEYGREIDEWIRRVDDEADQAHTDWLSERHPDAR